MGVTFKAASVSAGAPDVEAGIWAARFDGISAKVLEKSQFDPNVFEWAFTLLDETGAVVYDEGEPIEVTALTSRSMNTKSKTTPRAVRYLKAILTPAEFATFEDEEGAGLDADALAGRVVQVIIEINDNGWPKITDVMPAPRAKSKAKPSGAAPAESE